MNKSFFCELSAWLNWFIYIAPILVIFRNGLNYWGYDYYALSWAKVWPKPLSVFSVENFGNLALARVLGINSRIGWVGLHIFLTAFFFLLLIYFVNRELLDISGKQSMFIVIFASPLSMMLMQEIGYFDVITIIGALILASARSTFIQILGAVVMASGNTPQAMIAAFIFCSSVALLSSTKNLKLLVVFTPFLLVCVIWLFERIWLNGLGRTEEFGPGMWSYSFKGFLVASPLFLYSIFGSLILLVPKIHSRIGHSIKSVEFQVLLGFILVPTFFGIVTTESTRDTLCIMAPTLVWYIQREIRDFHLRFSKWEFFVLCTLPSFLVWRQGQVVEPWSILRRLLFN